MTAEVIVMNKRGIAVAADSATTWQDGNTAKKITRSANKIEVLSTNPPIALVHCGNASFNGIPWSLVTHGFREAYPNPWKSLGQCARTFITYLGKSPIDKEACDKRYIRHVISELFSKTRNISEDQFQLFIERQIELIKKRPCFAEMQDEFPDFKDTTLNAIDSIYDNFAANGRQMYKKHANLFKSLIRSALKHECMFNNGIHTGIVITGYGTADNYPAAYQFRVLGNLDEKLVYKKIGEGKISARLPKMVIPLAQGDVAMEFFHGINPNFKSEMMMELNGIIADTELRIKDALQPYTANSKLPVSDFHDELTNILGEIEEAFRQRVDSIESNFKRNITTTVECLSLPDMAQMAQNIIDMTSFKRYVQQDDPGTVGGSTEVAVLAKTDGFVWVKHKTLADEQINRDFFGNVNR